MKRIYLAKAVKVIAAFCILFSAISCKNSVGQETNPEKEQTPAKTQEKEVYVKINAYDINSVINSASNSTINGVRTLNPSTKLSDLKDFVFSGKPSSSSAEMTELAKFDDYDALTNEGKIKVPYETTKQWWNFTLSAKLGDNIFTATAYDYFSEGDQNTLEFALSLTEFVDGEGAIAVTVDFSELESEHGDPSSVTKASVTLYDMNGNACTGQSITSFENNSFTAPFNNLSAGYYQVKIRLCKDDAELAFWPDIIFVAAGVTTSGTIKIEHFNPFYEISYELNAGSDTITYDKNITPPHYVTPSVKQIPTPKRSGYIFNGWYVDDSCNTMLTFPITETKTLYASWLSDSVTAENVEETIAAVKVGTKEAPVVIKVTGTISTTTISNISTALDNNSSVYFAIDLSGTTGLATIASTAFYHLENLVSIELPETITTINNSAFAYSGLTAITIPAKVTSIGDSVFAYCSDLEEVDFANNSGCTSIGSSVFENCNSLTSITIPDSVTSIGASAFCSCSSLTGIVIPEGVTILGNELFCGCTSLVSVNLPENLTSIGKNAFDGTAITSITIPTTLTTIGDDAFDGCKNLKTIVVDDGNTNFALDGGILYKLDDNDDLSEIVVIPEGAETVTIGSDNTTVSELPASCFACSNIPNVVIGDNISKLPDRCFYESKVKSITIGSAVEEIGENAFYDCRYLEKIIVDEDNAYFIVDDDGALLTADGKELLLYPAASSATSYVISKDVEIIHAYAFFMNDNLEKITFEDSKSNWYYSGTYYTSPAEIIIQYSDYYVTKLSSSYLSNAQDFLVGTASNYVFKVDMDDFYANAKPIDVYYGENLNVSHASFTLVDSSNETEVYRFHALVGKEYTINWVDDHSYDDIAYTNYPDPYDELLDCIVYLFDENGDYIWSTDDDPSYSFTAKTETVYVIIQGRDQGLYCAFRVWKEKEASKLNITTDTDICIGDDFDQDTNLYTYIADEGYDEYHWNVDNYEKAYDTNIFVFDPSKYNKGVHMINLEAKKDGYTYTYTTQIFVE